MNYFAKEDEMEEKKKNTSHPKGNLVVKGGEGRDDKFGETTMNDDEADTVEGGNGNDKNSNKDNGSMEKVNAAPISTATTVKTTRSTRLEDLSLDVLSWLLSYLKIQEIMTVSMTGSYPVLRACRSDKLWKIKFESRWFIDSTFRVLVSGQNWYKSYQKAYENPNDLWIFHWNITYPQDGLVPGRCCIYDNNHGDDRTDNDDVHDGNRKDRRNNHSNSHDICPRCRFFPTHPIQYARSKEGQLEYHKPLEQQPKQKTTTEIMAQATDYSIRDFCHRHTTTITQDDDDAIEKGVSSYSAVRATKAFQDSATYHRTIDVQQYKTASKVPRYHDDENYQLRKQLKNSISTATNTTTCLVQLQDLLFYNVTEEPLSTKEGFKELQHLRKQRKYQQQWERKRHSNTNRNTNDTDGDQQRQQQQQHDPSNQQQEFIKPAHETSHHTWHQAVLTNPDFCRPLVYRVCIQRPDCFACFPSEGYIEPGQSKLVFFCVRPLGSLIATVFETINATRSWYDKNVYDEEATLPTQPFAIQYKYSSVIPCIPAKGFVRNDFWNATNNNAATAAAARSDTNTNPPKFPSVVDICWENKKMIDYHWSGADPNNATVDSHEIRCLYLSAHVNSHYPFSKFRQETLTPFDLTVDPTTNKNKDTSPLYFSAAQLAEFYPNTIYPQLQQVRLETEVSHAGQEFRTHRKQCLRCRRASWGPRLEEMGQAFVLAKLEDWAWQQRQTTMLQNGITIVRTLYNEYQQQRPQPPKLQGGGGGRRPGQVEQEQQQQQSSSSHTVEGSKDLLDIDDGQDTTKGGSGGGGGSEGETNDKQTTLIRTQQLLYVVHRMILKYRSALYVNQQLRTVLARLEITASILYGIKAQQVKGNRDNAKPWRKSGSFRFLTCTHSVFDPQQQILGAATDQHDQWNQHIKDEPEEMDAFRRLLNTPGQYTLGPQEDSNHPGELQPPDQPSSANMDMFLEDPIQSLRCAIITLRCPRSIVCRGLIYDRVSYPGKICRRPKIPGWVRNGRMGNQPKIEYDAASKANSVYYHLQDALDVHYVAPPSPSLGACRSISLRRFLRNVPPLGMARYPMCIDDGYQMDSKTNEKEDKKAVCDRLHDGELDGLEADDIRSSSAFRVVQLQLPSLSRNEIGAAELTRSGNLRAFALQSEMNRTVNQRHGHPGGPPLLRGPGPRLLSLLWSISAQLGWAVDDGSQAATLVHVKRELLISLQWLSLTLMAAPLFWTLVARAVHWIPTKPVDYLLEDIPYQLTSEMRFLSEPECGAAAIALVIVWLFLGRWSERWTARDFNRAQLEHWRQGHHTFLERLQMRYMRRWDELCPIFLQRFSYSPPWNVRPLASTMKHICFWRSEDSRERRSVFLATAGRGLMFCGKRWREVIVEDQSSRKLLLAGIAALGSFGSSTPHFWTNVLTVFSCSISLGLSISLLSLERGVTGGSSGSIGGVLKSLNLVTLVSLVILLGQLLGSSGGVLFLAEFVVTSISFILGGAGTISASSVESWGCFFCLSTTAFWGYLSGTGILDGLIRQKRYVQSSLFSTTLLCASLAAVVLMWVWIVLWRWDVPASLMILRTGFGLATTPREASAAVGTEAHSAAVEYAAKNLQ